MPSMPDEIAITSGDPLLSIITPTYNSSRFFHETVASVMGLQLDCPFEWIIVDDLSSDGTAETVADLAAHHPRIRFLPNSERAGDAWANYLRGLSFARGKYVLFLDHDDALSTSGVAAALASLEMCPHVDAAISKVDYMDEDSRIYKRKSIPFATYGGILSGRCFLWTLFLSPTYPLKWGAVLIRRTLFAKTGPVFDIDFMLAAAQHTGFSLIPLPGLRYRNVRGSISAQRLKKKESFWVHLAFQYFPNNRYYGLAYIFSAYKYALGWLKVLYSTFTPNRI